MASKIQPYIKTGLNSISIVCRVVLTQGFGRDSLKGLLLGKTAKFKRVNTLCEGMVFMAVKGSKDIMEQVLAFASGASVVNRAVVTEPPQTPRRKGNLHAKGQYH